MRQMQGGGGKGAFSFGKSKAKMLTADQVKRLADVAGCDEAKKKLAKWLISYVIQANSKTGRTYSKRYFNGWSTRNR